VLVGHQADPEEDEQMRFILEANVNSDPGDWCRPMVQLSGGSQQGAVGNSFLMKRLKTATTKKGA
jgi:hypothetical protein